MLRTAYSFPVMCLNLSFVARMHSMPFFTHCPQGAPLSPLDQSVSVGHDDGRGCDTGGKY